jgi:hypothetical protein
MYMMDLLTAVVGAAVVLFLPFLMGWTTGVLIVFQLALFGFTWR